MAITITTKAIRLSDLQPGALVKYKAEGMIRHAVIIRANDGPMLVQPIDAADQGEFSLHALDVLEVTLTAAKVKSLTEKFAYLANRYGGHRTGKISPRPSILL